MPGFIARSLRLCSLFAIVALILAACGSPAATPPSATTGASPAASADAGTAPATTKTASAGTSGQTIKVTTTNAPDENNPADIARHQQLLAEFKQVRPDVEVEAHQGGFDKEAFTAKFAGGTMEDTYLVPFTEPQEMIARGQAADITDLIKGWENFDSFNPEVLKIAQDSQGKIYGVPVGGYALGLLYNRKLFQETGLDPNKPPTTWDEVREYAKKLTDPSKGRAGFAELSKGNQGGWHFTAWKYSFGGELVQQSNGKWTATFNDENGVKALQTLKDMRWTDKSMTEQQLLTVGDVLPLLATEQVAMAVMAPDALRDMKTKFQAKIEDFGMAPLPQGGGNGTLAGGAAWLFNPKSSPEVTKAAFDWTVNRDFNLAAFEADLKGRQERDDLIGFPELPLFTGEFQQQRQAIVAKYANAPLDNYTAYVESTLQLRTEPPVKTQELYAILDTAVQAVLTDQNTDPKQALDAAAQQFQTQVLDQIK